MNYIERVIEDTSKKNPHQAEFCQAVQEVLPCLEYALRERPEFEALGTLERLVEPERVIIFRVPWVNDRGGVEVNRGFRVQHCGALGPFKGGLRFHPSVNLSIMKFLAFEQTFKNALTMLPMGGGKGGSDFDPKNKSDLEIMRFCQSFMNELFRHVGADCDVPAGDIGVGAREIGYLFGQYRKITNSYEGVLTGKSPNYGGSLVRKEATGYGLLYFMEHMLAAEGSSMSGKRVVISGSGNVAIYAAQKAQQMGATVIALSDSKGYIHDKNGIDLELVKQLKEVEGARIEQYAARRRAVFCPDATQIWSVPCDVALPCATQNELSEAAALTLIKNGCVAVGEGSNMPCTPQAVHAFLAANVLFAPAKAANAGGVSVSGLEMTQNSMRLGWSFEEVDKRLQDIMKGIFNTVQQAAHSYSPRNYAMGANIAGFLRVAEAVIAQGVV